jgi:hypothetical protein
VTCFQLGQQRIDKDCNSFGIVGTGHLTTMQGYLSIPIQPVERLIEEAFRNYGYDRVVFRPRLAGLRQSSEVEQNRR